MYPLSGVFLVQLCSPQSFLVKIFFFRFEISIVRNLGIKDN